MGKKGESTPRSRVRQALRKLWLQSRERATALKRDNYTCSCCNRKQSKAKGKEFSVEVHHLDGVTNWEELIDAVYKCLLTSPDKLETICKSCHGEIHEKNK